MATTTTIISRAEMSLNEFKAQNGISTVQIKEYKDKTTGEEKHFALAHNDKNEEFFFYVSPNTLDAILSGETNFRYAECSTDKGKTWVPCIMREGGSKTIATL